MNPVGEILHRLAIVFEATAFKATFCSPLTLNHLQQFQWSESQVNCYLSTLENTLCLFHFPSGLVPEHEQICEQKLCTRYRTFVICGHPVNAATTAVCFTDHVTKRNDALGTRMPLSPPGLVSEHEEICGQKLRMHDQKCMIYGHR